MKTTKQSTFSATLRTTILMASLGGLLVVIGALIGGPQGAGLFLVIALLINAGSYFFSDKLALAASRAKPIDESEAPRLYQMVRELTTRAGPAPRHDPQRSAERLRDRPQSETRGRRGHPRDHQAPLRGRAPRRARP